MPIQIWMRALRFQTGLLGIAVSASMLCSGCGGTMLHGPEQIPARFTLGTLRAELPGSVDVLTASAAAESALRSRGYSVVRTSITDDHAVIAGEPPRAGFLESVSVQISVTNHATAVSVRYEPLGDEPASRAIFDTMLAGLGM